MNFKQLSKGGYSQHQHIIELQKQKLLNDNEDHCFDVVQTNAREEL